MKKLFTVLVLVIGVNIGFAQLEISAELRPRAEIRRGYRILPLSGVTPAAFISQRTRLNINYAHPRFLIGISLQDVRVWGDEQNFSSTGVFGDQASIDLKEGWIEILAGEKNAFKIGRQYLSYDDERLLAKRNWNQSAISYDALLYKFAKNDFKLHVSLSLNNNAENTFGGDYNLYREVIRFDSATQSIITEKVTLSSRIKSMNFLYLSKGIRKSCFSFIALATGVQRPESDGNTYFKGTYGLFYILALKTFNMRASTYYQHGKNILAKQVSAYMFNVFGQYDAGKLSVHAGIDYVSGQDGLKQDNSYQEKEHFFDIFYGARHKYYGLMDYFSNMYTATGGGGLVDTYGGCQYSLSQKVNLNADVHYFMLQNRVADPTAEDQSLLALDKALATEADFFFGIKIIPEIILDGGFSFILPTNSLEKIQGIQPGNSGFSYWAWVMLTAKPVFFTNSK